MSEPSEVAEAVTNANAKGPLHESAEVIEQTEDNHEVDEEEESDDYDDVDYEVCSKGRQLGCH